MTYPKSIKLGIVKTATSTNDVIRERAENGAEDLVAIQADIQTMGRGRRGRSWATIPEQSVACSILVRENEAPHLPLLTALSVCQAVKTWIPKAGIKWPNDILIRGKKLSGILVERFGTASNGYYIVGTGINVGAANDSFWQDIPHATSLAREGAEVSVSHVLELYLKYFSQMLHHYREHGWDNFLADMYRDNCISLGDSVTWKNGGREIKGQVIDIDAEGTLLLHTEGGDTLRILSGDIVRDAQLHSGEQL